MSTDNIIGKKYEADYEISFEKIKEFVEVLGDGGHPFAPPTFAAIYCQPALKNLYLDSEFSKLVPRLVHGEQEYNFGDPARAGDLIHTTVEIVEHFNKTNRSGKVHQIIEIMTTSTNQNDKLVCTATYRLVIRGE
jgi:hypothetical protein